MLMVVVFGASEGSARIGSHAAGAGDSLRWHNVYTCRLEIWDNFYLCNMMPYQVFFDYLIHDDFLQ